MTPGGTEVLTQTRCQAFPVENDSASTSPPRARKLGIPADQYDKHRGEGVYINWVEATTRVEGYFRFLDLGLQTKDVLTYKVPRLAQPAAFCSHALH